MAIKNFGAIVLFFLGLMTLAGQTSTIPQVADGGGWQTTLVITNNSTSDGTASISFFMDSGGGTSQPWNLTFLESVATQSLVVPAGSTVFLHTPGKAGTISQGWASMTAPSSLVTYVIFTQRVLGRQDQDGTANASISGSRFLVPFDNSAGFVTSMAIVNATSATESISVAFHTSKGTTIQGVPISVPSTGHLAFALPQQFSSTGGQSGLAEFYSTAGAFSILTLRFNSTGAFTAAPVFPQIGSPVIITSTGVPAIVATGTWSGSASDSTGPGAMTWLLTQTGSSISGPMTALSTSGAVGFVGTVSGIITGSTLTFTMDIPAGGISRLPTCSATVSGSGVVTSNSITGTYTGTNSCTGPFTNGIFSLVKQ